MDDIFPIDESGFTSKLNCLKKQYENDCIYRKNGTLLLGLGTIPKCRHMLFKPLTDELIYEYLQKCYKNKIPAEYIEFLKYSNGANLCCVNIKKKNLSYAFCMFSIYGLPRTQPFGRAIDEEEPYDIRIEDLARHKCVPQTWLKCGRYIKNFNFDTTYDIFIDTVTKFIYGCEKNNNIVVDKWNNLNQCFCDIFNSFSNMQCEYIL